MRPKTYSPELRDYICECVAVSQDGMRKMCDNNEQLPSYATLTSWLRIHADLTSQYRHAKLEQVTAMADEIVDISRDETLDANDKRIRVDTLKWLLSKLLPRTYGDKLDVTSGGEALSTPPHLIDARVQSIIMQARERKRVATIDVSALPPEAQSLLS